MFELTPFVHNNHFLNSYDPFKAMEEFEKNFFGHQLPAFKTDIRETENAYVLDAELPGFSKEDIHAEVSLILARQFAESVFVAGQGRVDQSFVVHIRS